MHLPSDLLQFNLYSHHRIRPTPLQQKPPIHLALSCELREVKLDRPKDQPVLLDRVGILRRVLEGLFDTFNLLPHPTFLVLLVYCRSRRGCPRMIRGRRMRGANLVDDQPKTRLRVLSSP